MSKKNFLLYSILIIIFTLSSCEIKEDPVKIIKISTEYGDFNVWTKKLEITLQKKFFYYMVVLVLTTNILKDLNLIFQVKKSNFIITTNLVQH
jgi:hypothetical protein